MKKFLSIVSIFFFIISYSQIRDEITYLNGEWEIIYDYDNIGKLQAYNTDEGFSKGKIEKITVPSVWERFKKDYEGVVYYRTSFKVDKDYNPKWAKACSVKVEGLFTDDLMPYIVPTVNNFLKGANMSYKDLKVNQPWKNTYKKGGFQELHDHGDAFLSGCIFLDNPDPECDLNYSAHIATKKKITLSLSNSFGFGGTNATLIFKELD